ncbi:MAG: hypothetical protein EVG15_07420 [Candidatus Acididesulfobacter diazotrophicus]|jgi:hypothetical protein|uniref:Lipoprotein n=1 Tax=Candidatus Acididesulfobacter diazotrophicus TaxID=2597226 RepID=A0A519BLM5_9DELT|nr:MAG: hypothetical protein EVG15_07420 [Candidatus Acididesulfobacter diazotrophicus]
MKFMKLKKSNMKIIIVFSVILFVSFIFSGCAYYVKPTPPPLALSEIIKLCKERVPNETIIKKIRASHEVFYLTAREIIKLHRDGITAIVLDYMLKTGIRKKQHRALQRGYQLRPHYWMWYNWQWAPYAPYPYFYPY